MKFTQTVKTDVVHFVGIGGIGMSGIAMVMHSLGYRVQGSDIAESDVTKRLRDAGITVFEGHATEHAQDADTLVVSAAIAPDNVEVLEAKRRRLPIMQRAEMLAELMRFKFGIAVAGTHGKTTVTSLLAHLLTLAQFDPTYVIGGCVKSSGESAAAGSGDYLIVEADESDGSFLRLDPIVDNDHLGHYDGEFKQLESAFAGFMRRVPFYGAAVVCRDDHHLQKLCEGIARRFITYGLNSDSDVRAKNIRYTGATTLFDVEAPWCDDDLKVHLNLPGYHNVLNALATIAVAHELAIDDEIILRALKEFQGIARRFHVYPDLRLDDGVAHLVDDYGHHPTEIAATLETVDKVWPGRRKVVVFQPHRYTRTHQLFDHFVEALRHVDELVLLDVYPAGEAPIEGADNRAISAAIQVRADLQPVCLALPEDTPPVLKDMVRADDVVVVLGAGNVGCLAQQLTEEFHAVA